MLQSPGLAVGEAAWLEDMGGGGERGRGMHVGGVRRLGIVLG